MKVLGLLVAAALAADLVAALVSGVMLNIGNQQGAWTLRRQDDPVGYWLRVVFVATGAMIWLLVGSL